jgi:CRISPR-associated exonuclease Cas4
MKISGTHINYYLICKRKLWLFHHKVQMEGHSELVKMGKLIHETSYPGRTDRYEEIEVAGIKIDYYDPKHKVVHEIKKNGSYEEAHAWQLKFYLHTLREHGFGDVTGILEYPVHRETKQVILAEQDIEHLQRMMTDIRILVNNHQCLPAIHIKGCKKCAYFDFCFVTEEPNE